MPPTRASFHGKRYATLSGRTVPGNILIIREILRILKLSRFMRKGDWCSKKATRRSKIDAPGRRARVHSTTPTPRFAICSFYAPRSLGSSLSRTASPRRFEANTTKLMAVPGKRTIHGAFWANSAAETESILPHEG